MPTKDAPTAAPPTALGPLALAGVAVAAATFGGLTVWSATAPLSSAARASGFVVVDSNRKAVQHFEGGTVKSILVKDGDSVQAGQLLVELDDVRLSTMLAALKPLAQINAAMRARLMAEREGADDIRFPSELIDPTDIGKQSIVADQRKAFAARRTALNSQRAAFANQREQAEALVAGLQRQLESQRKRLRLTQEEQRGVAALAKKGYSPARRVLELDRAIAELEREEAALRAKLEEASKQAEYGALGVQRTTDAFAEEVEDNLQRVEIERYDYIDRLQKISEQLDRSKVVAPVAGTVVNRVVHTIGGVVAKGATLLEIVPGGDPLVIEARVRPMDVEGLEVGMPVEIRFPGLRDKLLPRMHGQLVMLSPDLLMDESTSSRYFAARVQVAEDALQAVGRDRLRPGMPVDVMLVKRSQTVFGYLMGPLDDFFSRAMRE